MCHTLKCANSPILSMFSCARRIAEGVLGRGRSAVKPGDEEEFFSLGPAGELKHRVAHQRTTRSGIEIITVALPEVPSSHYDGPGIPIRLYRHLDEQVRRPRSEAWVSERRGANPHEPRSDMVPSQSRHASLEVLAAHYDRPGMPRWYKHMSEQVLGPRPDASVSERRYKARPGRVPSRSRYTAPEVSSSHYDRPGMPMWDRRMSEPVHGPARAKSSISDRRGTLIISISGI